MTPPPRSAAIYARISSDQTGEGLGVQRQLEDCRKLAAERGWVVGEEYVDNDISAFKGKVRPEYKRMLDDLASGMRDGVVTYNLDRLTRQPIELEQFAQLCEQVGVSQLATVTADIDMGSDDGLFVARIFAAFAAKESARKSARVRRKALQLAEQGMPHGGPLRPFGFEEDKVTVRAEEAAVIKALVARFLAGESVRSLCMWLNEEGVTTVAGGPWQTTTMRQVLRSARIAGLREHKGQVSAPAVWAAIITPEQRQQVLNRMEAKRVSGTRALRSYLLSGLLRCGKCGNKLYSSRRAETRRYVCQSGPDHGGCGRLTVVAAPVEEWISAAVLHRLDTPELADALAGRRAADERQATILAELEADRDQLAELARMFGSRELRMDEWKAAREPIEARIRRAEQNLGRLTGTSQLDGLVGAGQQLRERWGGLNLERQAAIVKAVLDYATVRPGTPGARALDPARLVPVWRL
ncbi:recombinase family protein [Sinomonas soli]